MYIQKPISLIIQTYDAASLLTGATTRQLFLPLCQLLSFTSVWGAAKQLQSERRTIHKTPIFINSKIYSHFYDNVRFLDSLQVDSSCRVFLTLSTLSAADWSSPAIAGNCDTTLFRDTVKNLTNKYRGGNAKRRESRMKIYLMTVDTQLSRLAPLACGS